MTVVVGEGVPPGVDLFARVGGEGDVQAVRWGVLGVGVGDREVVPLVEAGRVVALAGEGEQLEHLTVEVAAGCEIGDADGDVVDRAHRTPVIGVAA